MPKKNKTTQNQSKQSHGGESYNYGMHEGANHETFNMVAYAPGEPKYKKERWCRVFKVGDATAG